MRHKLSSCLTAALALALLAGCGSAAAHPNPTSRPVETLSAVQNTPEPTPEPTPTPEPAPTPEPEDDPAPSVYEFGVPVEESEPVADDSFFDNAVFLGDSRTEGLQLFSGLQHGTFYWARGLSVFRADDEDFRFIPIGGKNYSVVGALKQHSFDLVYIMIGVNELGMPAESYESGLSNLVDQVLATQPDAVIYLQLMPPLNDAMCQASGLEWYINNDNLRKFNEVIQRVAEEKKVALLNTAEVYTGEDGQLPAELANDGCHFVFSGYTLWADYIRSHVIDRDLYFYSREQALEQEQE